MSASLFFQALVNKLLYALAFIGLSCIDVALTIRSETVRCVELAWATSSVTEACQNFQSFSFNYVYLEVLSIRQVQVLLLSILGEIDIPSRTLVQCLRSYLCFFHESAVFAEDLNTV